VFDGNHDAAVHVSGADAVATLTDVAIFASNANPMSAAVRPLLNAA